MASSARSTARVWPIVAALVGTKVLVHLLIIERYGYHGDELYFIECAKHLSFGYVDHPPVVPWIAWLAGAFDYSIVALRLPSMAAQGATMVLLALLVREWGGGRVAQLLAGICFVFAPAYLRMGAMLDIPVFEVLLWTSCSYGVARVLQRRERRAWLLVGLLAGLGLLTKHSMGLWGAGLVVGLLATHERRQFRSPWLWGGGAIALLVFLTLLASSYSKASAARFFGEGLPRATSGHLTYHLWGPEPGDVVIAWGLSELWLREHFAEVTQVDRVVAPLARPQDADVPVYVCRVPTTSTAARWAALRNFDNTGTHPSIRRKSSAVQRSR